MVLTNHTGSCFVFSKDAILRPNEDLTIDNADYADDARLRYNINRIVGDGTGDISIVDEPVGYPDESTDPQPETTPRLKPMFQVK